MSQINLVVRIVIVYLMQMQNNYNNQELNTVYGSSNDSENSDSFFKFRQKSNDLSQTETSKKQQQKLHENSEQVDLKIIQPIHQEQKLGNHLEQKAKDIQNMKTSLQESYKILGSRQSPHLSPKITFVSFAQQARTQEYEHKSKQQQITKEDFIQNIKLLQSTEPKQKPRKSHRFDQIQKQIYVYLDKEWKKDLVKIINEKLIINKERLNFGSIFKLKLYKPQPIIQMNELKINYVDMEGKNQLYFVNVKSRESIKKASYHYLTYIQLLIRRLKSKGQYIETIWDKKAHISEQKMFGSYIFGEIYKKSQNLGKWQKRYIIVNSEGIFSYKSFQRKQHSFFIQRESVSYIWTRFQFMNGYLVVKLKHGLKQTEFGIPVVNFSFPHHKNWLFYFYKLMSK